MNNAIIATDSGIMEETATNRIGEKQESLEILVYQTDRFRALPRTTTMHHPSDV